MYVYENNKINNISKVSNKIVNNVTCMLSVYLTYLKLCCNNRLPGYYFRSR